MDLLRRVPPRVRGLLLLLAAAVLAGLELWEVLGGVVAVGIDFEPLRAAAQAVLHGAPVYTDPAFVYPPTAALVLLPTALGGPAFAFGCWVVFCSAALGLAGWLICRAAEPGHRLYFGGAVVLTLLGSSVAHRSLFLGNMSELLVPFAVGVLLSFQRGRWTLGCALLAASLLLKPLLAPLLLVPVLRGQWVALLRTMLPGVLVLLASMVLVPGGMHFPAVLRYCLSGTDLHGTNAAHNLSLRGWAEGHGAPATAGLAASGLVVLLVIVRVAAAMRAGRPAPAWLGTVLLLGVFLAGAISEVHFLLVAIATTLLHLASRRRGRRAWLSLLPGLALLGLPSAYQTLVLGRFNDGQSWLIGGELALLVALATLPAPETAAAPAALPADRPVLVPVPA